MLFQNFFFLYNQPPQKRSNLRFILAYRIKDNRFASKNPIQKDIR